MSQSEVFAPQMTLPRPKYEPKALSELHHSILRLHMLGYTGREICSKLGCTQPTVTRALNCSMGRFQTSLMRAELDGTAMEAAKQIRALAPKALQVIEDVLDDVDAPTSVRLRAAQDALDRAGFGAVKKVDVNSTSVSLSQDDLVSLRETALARARLNGLVVDSQPCDYQDISETSPTPTGLADSEVLG